MFILILTIIYALFCCGGAWLIAKKKKSGFVISSIGCTLQLLHVILDPTVFGLAILAGIYIAINVMALRSVEWHDEDWW